MSDKKRLADTPSAPKAKKEKVDMLALASQVRAKPSVDRPTTIKLKLNERYSDPRADLHIVSTDGHLFKVHMYAFAQEWWV